MCVRGQNVTNGFYLIRISKIISEHIPRNHFTKNAVLHNHFKSYREKRFQTKNQIYKYLCLECEARYQRRDQLERHTSAVHTGEKPLRCDWPGCDFETVLINKINLINGN